MVKKGEKFPLYTLEQYLRAIELKKQGYGSLRIAKAMGLNSSGVVEGWINDGRKPYYFSEKRIAAQHSTENIKRMRAMNLLNQPKAIKISAEIRAKKLPEESRFLSEDLAYLLGVVYGDGHISTKNRRVILGVTDEDFALKFKNTIERWSGFKARFFTKKPVPKKYIQSKKTIYVVYIDSRDASRFLKSFDIYCIRYASPFIRGAFLRGFFDSEGWACKSRAVKCCNTDLVLITFIRELLKSLGIEQKIEARKVTPLGSYNCKKIIFYIAIHRKESVLNFYKWVGFSIQRKQERLVHHVNTINPVRR